MAQGYLQVDVISDADNFPIDKALVEISRTEEPEQILEQVTTNRSGQTENLTLDAPLKMWSANLSCRSRHRCF